METYYDDAGVTLGDDGTSVDQGAFGIQRVGGSKSFVRDPRLSALAASVLDKPGRPGASRPETTHVHIAPIPKDEWGDPMRLCSGGHYESKRRFGKRVRNFLHGDKTGLDDYCLKCRKLQRHLHTSSTPA